LVRRNKDADAPLAVKIQGNRQLQRIERPQALYDEVIHGSAFNTHAPVESFSLNSPATGRLQTLKNEIFAERK
jgi:hypothetical protein